MAPIGDSFERALAKFKAQLKPQQANEFKSATLNDVKKEIASIQIKQRARKGLRDMVRVLSFLEAMEGFGKVIEVFLNDTPVLSYIWGPLKLLLQTASQTANSYETLLHAYNQIGENLPVFEIYKQTFESNDRMQDVLVLVFEDILFFHQKAIHIFEQPMWQRLYRDLWQDFKTQFSGILNQLKQHKELIESQGQALHLQQYRHDREKMFREFQEIRAEARRHTQRAVIDWIAAAATSSDHDASTKTRELYIETGRWILTTVNEFKTWLHANVPPFSVLWMNGKPGAGKTILASVIIEHLIKDQQQQTAYFYCKHNDPFKRTYQAVLKSVLSQLVVQDTHLLPYFKRRQELSSETTLNSIKTCEQMIETVLCNRSERICLVIDGLDECAKSERRDILTFFQTQVRLSDQRIPGNLRVLFVSQNENDVAGLLRTAAKWTLERRHNEGDIASYVSKHCETLRRKFTDISDADLRWVAKMVREKADGMFLFAKLVMENLTAQVTLQGFRAELDKFPDGINQAYERIVTRILDTPHEQQRKLTERLLKWNIAARRPLVWREIQAMASLDLEELAFDFEALRIRGHIKDLCGSLVEVLPSGRIEFVHQTAITYLSKNVFVGQADADMSLATICLQYLTMECFEASDDFALNESFARRGDFAFEDYACAHWGDHILTMLKLFNDDVADGKAGVYVDWSSFGHAIRCFFDVYEQDLDEQPERSIALVLCQNLENLDWHEELLAISGSAKVFSEMRDDQRDQIQLAKLLRSLNGHRELLQYLSRHGNFASREPLRQFYGDNWFKCPKLTCYYFHEGFYMERALREHEDFHDRPYCCTYDDCPARSAGFASPSQLQKHKLKMHAETEGRPDTFSSLRTHVEVQGGKRHKCPICSKSLGRSHNYKMHMLSHEDKREQLCNVCGKSFVRRHDRLRHERTIHKLQSSQASEEQRPAL